MPILCTSICIFNSSESPPKQSQRGLQILSRKARKNRTPFIEASSEIFKSFQCWCFPEENSLLFHALSTHGSQTDKEHGQCSLQTRRPIPALKRTKYVTASQAKQQRSRISMPALRIREITLQRKRFKQSSMLGVHLQMSCQNITFFLKLFKFITNAWQFRRVLALFLLIPLWVAPFFIYD